MPALRGLALLAAVAACWGSADGAKLARHLQPVSSWSRNSRHRLVSGDAACFRESARTGDMDRVLCEVGDEVSARLPNVLKRKELFEAHAVAVMVNRHFPSGPWDVVELASGCGLLAIFLVLLDPRRRVLCVDKVRTPIAVKLLEGLSERWPELPGRISHEVRDVRDGAPLDPGCLLVSCHACGFLSDDVVVAAAAGGARRPLVLLPCCYKTRPVVLSERPRPGRPSWSWERWPWLKGGSVNRAGPAAVDEARAEHLRGLGYDVLIDGIDSSITDRCLAVVAR